MLPEKGKESAAKQARQFPSSRVIGVCINFSPGVIRVFMLQKFANSGVLPPDFETFIVAAETCFISSIIYYDDSFTFTVRIVNCIQK